MYLITQQRDAALRARTQTEVIFTVKYQCHGHD